MINATANLTATAVDVDALGVGRALGGKVPGFLADEAGGEWEGASAV